MNKDTENNARITFDEATRYMDNAYKELLMAKKNGLVYDDTKHVSGACGIAYKGVLIALDGILVLKGIERNKGRVSIDYYKSNVAKLDKKMLNSLNVVYEILHLSGYYDGFNNVKILTIGFKEAENIIKKLKQSI